MPEDEREGLDEEDSELELEESQPTFSTLTIVLISSCLFPYCLEMSSPVLALAEEDRDAALLSCNVV
jgi:hypothetical protein